MNPHIKPHLPALEVLCQQFGVSSLRAFGSVLRQDFSADSDIDLLVEFDDSDLVNEFQRFFGFKEAVEQLLDRPVDLVTSRSLVNPHFKKELEETSEALYAA
ncbi:nucleotidyltransferase family protein [Haloferula sp. A504]|uniref:nucleotidyltransferase family protein n=1 Tax=Haloferula sp. A504 TaxID=3373601 RepID=UPI0031C82BD5|nr:nucleotidyltransferase domain-containing protein [Verrucomicrobiaceae bacterium E54]